MRYKTFTVFRTDEKQIMWSYYGLSFMVMLINII